MILGRVTLISGANGAEPTVVLSVPTGTAGGMVVDIAGVSGILIMLSCSS